MPRLKPSAWDLIDLATTFLHELGDLVKIRDRTPVFEVVFEEGWLLE